MRTFAWKAPVPGLRRVRLHLRISSEAWLQSLVFGLFHSWLGRQPSGSWTIRSKNIELIKLSKSKALYWVRFADEDRQASIARSNRVTQKSCLFKEEEFSPIWFSLFDSFSFLSRFQRTSWPQKRLSQDHSHRLISRRSPRSSRWGASTVWKASGRNSERNYQRNGSSILRFCRGTKNRSGSSDYPGGQMNWQTDKRAFEIHLKFKAKESERKKKAKEESKRRNNWTSKSTDSQVAD